MPLIKAYMVAIMREVLAIGRAVGVDADIDPEARIDMARMLGKFKTSMLQDMEAGKRLEIDGLLAGTLEIAQKAGVPAPFTESLFGLIRAARRDTETIPDDSSPSPLRGADDGLDRPALPLLPAPGLLQRLPLHRDDHHRRAAPRRRRAAPRFQPGRASGRRAARRQRARRPGEVREARSSSTATTKSTSTSAARASACSAALSAPA